MRALIASVLAVTLICTVTVGARPQVSPDVWRNVAQKLSIGSIVKIRTVSREQVTGILFAVDDQGLIVKPRTRVPEPARRVAYDQIDDLRLEGHRTGFGKAAGIGAAIGASVFAVMILILVHSD